MADIAFAVVGIAQAIPMFMNVTTDFMNNLNGINTSEADRTHVRIALGSTVNVANSFSGKKLGVSLWDCNGSAIGFTDGSKNIVSRGAFVDVTIKSRMDIGNVQPEYLSITNGGDDAICIAGVAIMLPDGGPAGFSTDVAQICGAPWAYSDRFLLETPPSAGAPTSKCVWLDRDGSNGLLYQGMGFHIPSFTQSSQEQGSINQNLAISYANNTDLMCRSAPRFRMYPKLAIEQSIVTFQHPLEFLTRADTDDESLIGIDKDPGFIINNPGVLAADLRTGVFPGPAPGRRTPSQHRHHGISKQATTAQWPAKSEYLIVSPHARHSARELCESATSWGHSWVSTFENLFCDMRDKSLYYTCSHKVRDCCLDTQTHSFHACYKTSVRPPIRIVNGVAVSCAPLRTRCANGKSDPSW